MSLDRFLATLATDPAAIEFDQTMAVIADHYDYSPTRFTNGEVVNEAGTNEGSCKLFAFARRHHLDRDATLALFGHHYRDVLADPDGTSHANIRAFMKHGWEGIHFDGEPLTPRGEEAGAVAALDAEGRYDHFLERMGAGDPVWGLCGDDGWVILSDEGDEHLPVWPHAELARQWIEGPYADCRPTPITAADWREKWLPGMARDGLLVAVCPDTSGEGIVVEAVELAEALKGFSS